MASEALSGVFRSLRTYHGDAGRAVAMDRLYSQFLEAGDLAFDIGSHVGDRVSSFRRCQAHVLAVEPQPLAFRALRLIHGGDQHVKLVQAACSERNGQIKLLVNSANPTVSTASRDFIDAAGGAEGWRGQNWDRTIEVPCVALDCLIEKHGTPRFTKIDVEGFEAQVLAGLSCPLVALSFEFTTIQRDIAMVCLDRLMALGPYHFNVALGESQRLEFDQPCDASAMRGYIDALPHDANSGDIYALLDKH